MKPRTYKLSEFKTSIDAIMASVEGEIIQVACKNQGDLITLNSERLNATRREIRAKLYKLFLDAAAMHGLAEEQE